VARVVGGVFGAQVQGITSMKRVASSARSRTGRGGSTSMSPGFSGSPSAVSEPDTTYTARSSCSSGTSMWAAVSISPAT
jgi:hypothetical protein